MAGSHQPVRLPQLATSYLRWPLLALEKDNDADSIAPISSYISYRQSFAHHPAKKPRFGASNAFGLPSQPEESRRLISETGGFEEDGDMVIEMDLLPPRWVDVQEEVSELLADIAQKSTELDKLHQKHLLPGFGDEDLRRHDEGIIERLTQDVTRSFHSCQKSIKRIDMMVRESKQQGGVTSGEETMAKNIQISLASRVQESSARFRKKQSTYLKSKSAIFCPFARRCRTHMCELAGGLGTLHVKLTDDVSDRATRPGRSVDTIRSLTNPSAKSIRGSFLDGIGSGQIILADDADANPTTGDGPKRRRHRATRT